MSDRDPGLPLLHAIVRDAATRGILLRAPSVETYDWASATFVGHRHRIAFDVACGDPAAWLARLPAAEWLLPGHVVVDVAVADVRDAHVALVALTIVDR